MAVAEVEPDGVRLDNGMRLKNQELLAGHPADAVTYATRGSPSTTASAWTWSPLRHLYAGASRELEA